MQEVLYILVDQAAGFRLVLFLKRLFHLIHELSLCSLQLSGKETELAGSFGFCYQGIDGCFGSASAKYGNRNKRLVTPDELVGTCITVYKWRIFLLGQLLESLVDQVIDSR